MMVLNPTTGVVGLVFTLSSCSPCATLTTVSHSSMRGHMKENETKICTIHPSCAKAKNEQHKFAAN